MKHPKISVLGIDPGIANTCWAIVSANSVGKLLILDSGCIRTASSNCDGSRYAEVYSTVSKILIAHTPPLVAIERVYFNRNVSSAMTTHGAIAICQLSAAQIGIESVLLKPQAVKAAIGFATADKAKVKQMVAKLTGAKIRSAHANDAVAVAIAGLLTHR